MKGTVLSRRIISLFLVLVCLVSVTSAVSIRVSAASDSNNIAEIKGVTIQNAKTKQYLNYDYGVLKNGTPLRVWPWDGSKEQLFNIDKVGTNTYRILTNASSKYAVDVYRGNAKLKAGQLCDIWSAGSDTIAQNIQFYACSDGSYILRMSNNTGLALAAAGSKERVKLVKFNQNDAAQKWFFKDANGKNIDIQNNSITAVSGITSSAYKKTGSVYTIGGAKYYQAKTTRDYNGVAKNTLFFVGENGKVVIDSSTLSKLHSMVLFNTNDYSYGAMLADTAENKAKTAQEFLSIYLEVAANEKIGEFLGKGTGSLLKMVFVGPISAVDAALEITKEFTSPDALKEATFLALLLQYSNNATVYGQETASLINGGVTDYDTMIAAVDAYIECEASFAVLNYLMDDQLEELADSNFLLEGTKNALNILKGLADSIVPDEIDAFVKLLSGSMNSILSLAECAEMLGTDAVFAEKHAYAEENYFGYLSANHEDKKKIADKLAESEIAFVMPLSSSYSTNITTQKWANNYSGHGYHLGVDLGTKGNNSTTVNAIAGGEVYRIVKESKSGGWGNLVIVKHTLPTGKVFYSGYAHLKSFASIREGQTIDAGTKVGMMGNTGNSTGPHLHLLVFTGSFSKSMLPAGYANTKFTGDSVKYKGLTYYNPLKVISSNGALIG